MSEFVQEQQPEPRVLPPSVYTRMTERVQALTELRRDETTTEEPRVPTAFVERLASVGRAAVSEGASQLAGLAGKYFGGAGTPEQAVKVCAYTLASLRKIVTAYRHHLAKTPVNDFLMAHAERALASEWEREGEAPRAGQPD